MREDGASGMSYRDEMGCILRLHFARSWNLELTEYVLAKTY